MADIDRLEALVAKLTEANVNQKLEIDRLIRAMGQGQGGGGNNQQPDVATARAKKVTSLKLAFRKSSKVKDVKDDQDLKVQEWLR